MFDTTIQVIGLDVAAPDEETIAAGAPPLLQYVLVAGLALPFEGPDKQQLRVPAGQIRFALPKDVALEFAEVQVEHAEKLPDLKESDLIIANSLQGVDRLDKQMQDIAGTGPGKR